MKVFVAGGSGALGRRLVPRLAEAGHEVVATTRDAQRAEALRSLGAEPVVCDVFDAARLTEAMRAAAPEIVVNQLTRLPQRMNPRKLGEHYAANDRVRREGTRNLLEAARASGARRMVAQSVAFWYAPRGDGAPHAEEDPLHVEAPEPIGSSVRTMREVEKAVLEAGEPEGVVLRYGFFYGPGTWYAPDGDVGEQVRRRRYPLIGRGRGVSSFVHVDDAAAATVAALDAPPGAYNVVDDDPAPFAVWLPEFADALGARPPRRVPAALAGLVAGRGPVAWLGTLEGAGNARAKTALGWEPRYASWRTGFREGLA